MTAGYADHGRHHDNHHPPRWDDRDGCHLDCRRCATDRLRQNLRASHTRAAITSHPQRCRPAAHSQLRLLPTVSKGNLSVSHSARTYTQGMSVSGNVIPAALIALDTGAGEFVHKSIMGDSEMKTPEMLKVNPWHQIPSMSDGEYSLGESNAIARYIAAKYAPALYGPDPEAKGVRTVLHTAAQSRHHACLDRLHRCNEQQHVLLLLRHFLARSTVLAWPAAQIIDWALDWASTNFYKSYAELWYPVAGFGAPPASYPEACTKACELAPTDVPWTSPGAAALFLCCTTRLEAGLCLLHLFRGRWQMPTWRSSRRSFCPRASSSTGRTRCRSRTSESGTPAVPVAVVAAVAASH